MTLVSKRSARFAASAPLLALALGFVLFETALRSWWPQEPVAEGPPVTLRDIQLGLPYPPNSQRRYRMPQRTVDMQFNSEGLRDAATHPIPKPAGLFRILLVGDSFTAGTANQYEEIWPVLLERRLAEKGFRADIVKAGVDSFDTHSELRMLQRLVPKYHPDLVLMAFLPNDIIDNTPFDAVPRARLDVVELGISLPRLQSFSFLKRLLLRSDFIYTWAYWMTSRRQYFTETQTSHAAEQYAVTRDLLLQASQYVRSEGGLFAVASIPQCFQVLAKAHGFQLPGLSVDSVDRRLSQVAGEQGFPWLSSLPVLAAYYSAHGDDLYYREDGHFTPLGSRIFGEWLVGEFQRLYAPQAPQKP